MHLTQIAVIVGTILMAIGAGGWSRWSSYFGALPTSEAEKSHKETAIALGIVGAVITACGFAANIVLSP